MTGEIYTRVNWCIGQIVNINKDKNYNIKVLDFKNCKKLQGNTQKATGIRLGLYVNRIELTPEINPHIFGQLTFDKNVKTI